jgi:hypothetical protein
MPYIYDSFTWDHCSDIDVDINDMLDGFYDYYVLGITDDDVAVGNITDDSLFARTNASQYNITANVTDDFLLQINLTATPTYKPTRSPDATHAVCCF